MREIDFRARRTDNGELVNGYFVKDYLKVGDSCIVTREYGIYEVDPDTVCEYTGKNDKNGTPIYEHDIVRGTYVGPGKGISAVAEVVFRDGVFGPLWGFRKELTPFTGFHAFEFEVIGNAHDNPELLAGGVN